MFLLPFFIYLCWIFEILPDELAHFLEHRGLLAVSGCNQHRAIVSLVERLRVESRPGHEKSRQCLHPAVGEQNAFSREPRSKHCNVQHMYVCECNKGVLLVNNRCSRFSPDGTSCGPVNVIKPHHAESRVLHYIITGGNLFTTLGGGKAPKKGGTPLRCSHGIAALP